MMAALTTWALAAMGLFQIVDIAPVRFDAIGRRLMVMATDSAGAQWFLYDGGREPMVRVAQASERYQRTGRHVELAEPICWIEPDGDWRCGEEDGVGRKYTWPEHSPPPLPPKGRFQRIVGGFSEWCGHRADGRLICGPYDTVGLAHHQWVQYPDHYVDFDFGQVTCGLHADGTARCFPDDSPVQQKARAIGLNTLDGNDDDYSESQTHDLIERLRRYIRRKGVQGLIVYHTLDRLETDPEQWRPISKGQPMYLPSVAGGPEVKVPADLALQRIQVNRYTTRLASGAPWFVCGLTIEGDLDCFAGDGWRHRLTGPYIDLQVGDMVCVLDPQGYPTCVEGPPIAINQSWLRKATEAHGKDPRVPVAVDRRPLLHVPHQPFDQIVQGDGLAIGLLPDGTVTQWGDAPSISEEECDACPKGKRLQRSWPPVVEAPVVQFALGEDFGCGVLSNQRVVCWGQNRHGEAAPPALCATQVVAGRRHACALTAAAGEVVCWGEHRAQQQRTPPGHFKALAAVDDETTCAQPYMGEAVCWGGALGPAPGSDLSGDRRPDLVGETVLDFPGARDAVQREDSRWFWTDVFWKDLTYAGHDYQRVGEGNFLFRADDRMRHYPDPMDRFPQWRPDIWPAARWLLPQDEPPTTARPGRSKIIPLRRPVALASAGSAGTSTGAPAVPSPEPAAPK